MNSVRLVSFPLALASVGAAAQWTIPTRLFQPLVHPERIAVEFRSEGAAGVHGYLSSPRGTVSLRAFRDRPWAPASPHSENAPNWRNEASIFGGTWLGGANFFGGVTANEARQPSRQPLGTEFDFLAPGYGYLGQNDALSGLATAEQAGEDIRLISTKANVGVSQYYKGGNMVFAGFQWGRDRLTNRNPFVDLNRYSDGDIRFEPDGDSSIDFNPESRETGQRFRAEGDFGIGGGWRLGAALTHETTSLSLSLTPGSQRALNSLAALDQRWVGAGRFLSDFEGFPLLDGLGNQVYALDLGAASPTIQRKETQTTAAVALFKSFRAKKQELHLSLAGRASGGYGGSKPVLLPSIVWEWRPTVGTHLVLGAKRTVSTPPLTAGEILGANPFANDIRPMIEDEVSIASDGKHGSVRFFNKWQQNPFELVSLIAGSRLLLPRLQQYDRGYSRGFAIKAFTSKGTEYPGFRMEAEWKQEVGSPYSDGLLGPLYPETYAANNLNTVSLTASWRDEGGLWEALLTHRSGSFSTDLYRDGSRVPTTVVDLRWSRGSWSAGISNLLNERRLTSFHDVGGATFQRGRTFWVRFTK